MSDEAPQVDLTDPRTPRLDTLKALGDNTRYAIYLELARSPLPLATAEIADILGLHVNTVRPHLERMRDVGLLEVDAEARGGVGRPQHRYSIAPGAPSLGLEPPSFPMLTSVLLEAAAAAGLDGAELADAARQQGRADGRRWGADTDPLEAVMIEQARLGFDPTVVEDDGRATVGFAHCPFRALAETHPDLVCSVHCGLVEGLLDEIGEAEIVQFHPLLDRNPCQVELSLP
jgi:predicted ArsR family transcriptional regulator